MRRPGGDEAENFQAVGVRLRECLISFIIETANYDLRLATKTGISRSVFSW
jgi:hypothetical protein